MSTKDRAEDKETGPLVVTVDNEDTGRPIEIHAGRGQTVQAVIDELYEKLSREPHPDDRLRCGDEDVRQHAGLKLKDYLVHCPDLEWVFTGPTGGAAP